MEEIYIVYWSDTGNTEAMAEAVAAGVKETGKEVLLLSPTEADTSKLKAVPGFAMGCPAMGDEVLEESEMDPFVEEVETFVSGKSVALFGSYGWGDGEWMRDWVDRMTKAGATVIGNEGVIAQESPDDDAIESCKELGRSLANLYKKLDHSNQKEEP